MSPYLLFWILGILLGLTAYISYFRAVFHKKTKPQLYTWLLWSLLAIIATIVQIKNNAGWGILVPCLMAISNTSLTLISLKHGHKHLSQKDLILLIATFITLMVWYFVKNDFVAILLVVTIDSIGFYFTWKKSYYHPYSEDLTSYVIWTWEFLCALLAIEDKNFINIFHPLLLTCTEFAFVIFLLWRRKIIKK